MKTAGQISLAILAWFLCAGLSLSPETWIHDITKKFGRTQPKYTNIKFWDMELDDYRGLRTFCYTTLPDIKNKPVDQRLHYQLVQLMSSMCSEVITLDYFKDNTKLVAENILLEMVDLWKQQGKVEPKKLFTVLPSFHCDILVLMERTHYDQTWKGDEKRLLIGINIAAFEMDFGEPIYMNHVLAEAPWFGMSASYAKAEHSALLQIVDEMGRHLKKAADFINVTQAETVRQAEKDQRMREREESKQLKAVERNFIEEVRQLERFVKENKEPSDLMTKLSDHLNAMKESLKKKTEEVTPDDWNQRNQQLAAVQYLYQQHQQWLAEQEILKKQQEVSEPPKENLPSMENPFGPVQVPEISLPAPVQQQSPPAMPGAMVPLPSVPIEQGGLTGRKWLIPANPSESFSASQDRATTPSTGGSSIFSSGNQVQETPLSSTIEPANETKPVEIKQPPLIPLDINEQYRELLKARAKLRESTAAQAQIGGAT
ncbi:MAG: hypothetical protein C4527_15675 [Candidatus Omnitrophota bacterium]|jgi:hypothetical protein|nr:MAG: hypothetical protein C4527_15675 [Candidatus Omnitrophota bacterium]